MLITSTMLFLCSYFQQTMTTVDKRLQAIQDELRSERQQLKKKHEEVGKISSELKQVCTECVDYGCKLYENHVYANLSVWLALERLLIWLQCASVNLQLCQYYFISLFK